MIEPTPTTHPQVFLRRSVAKETWVVLAHRMGVFRQLTKYWRSYASANETLDAIRQRLEGDPMLRKKYEGWTFMPLRIDNCVQNGLPEISKL